ncbi:MAG TPA: SRPBCC family protein [Casimicrobiaceae bacterium]
MTREAEVRRTLTMIAGGALLGAAAMFLLDPDKGRRRRALARDKARSLLAHTRDAVGVAGRDASHRVQGMRARARRFLDGGGAPDDLQVIERVRARMGRIVSHPHAIQVGANDGRVTLSGPILADEVQRLLDVVRTVWGVSDVEDRLVVHEHPESISSLQGGTDERANDSLVAHGNWAPASRMAAVLGGAGMALIGLRQRTPAGWALIGAGVGLAVRGATNLSMTRLVGVATGRCTIELNRTIEVSASPDAVYDAWTHWENVPRFMTHVEEVRDLGDGRTRWIVTGPAGTRLEWDARTTRSLRPQWLSWRTEAGSPMQHAGSVHFEPFADGTRVGVKMSYDAGRGAARALGLLLGSDPRRRLDEDLARMKAFVESGSRPAADVRPADDARPPLH